MEISLEKVDQVKERTGSTYKEAKEALEICGGDVLEAIIYIEGQNENSNMKNPEDNAYKENNSETIEDFKVWLKETIRIKVKKDETILVDVPVNAGIAATVIAVIIPPILAFGVIAAVATKLTIEITKVDGSVEVVNKYVAKAANEVKGKALVFADQIKTKIKEVKEDASDNARYKENVYKDDETVYSYTVNFDEEKEEK